MRAVNASLSILVLVAVACAPAGPSLAGKWSMSGGENMPPGAKVEANMAAPDKLTMTMDIPQTMPDGKKVNLHADVTGTYKLDGENMTMKADTVKFSGTGFPDNLKPILEAQFKDMGEQVKEQINKEGVTKFKWVDKDSFTLTGKSGKPETFSRIK